MPTYERLHDGQVVEAVNTDPNSHEDNRLGLCAMENTDPANGWRVVRFQEPLPAPEPDTDPAPVPPAKTRKAG